MGGHVFTTCPVFYGHNGSPSIFGLQDIDLDGLDILWILFVLSAMILHKSTHCH